MSQPAAGDAVRGSAAEADAGGSLEQYRHKRDFERTPEPAPSETPAPRQDFSFVVQKHAARRLHYDFRLELNGVLKSWAITKGPSLDPAEKRLAVHVEDHPLEYGAFEGVIPKGQYGGGTVMIWDRDRWEPEGDPEKGYAEGKLTFRLFGERLKGRWTLVRMGGRAGREQGSKNWLLIKSADEWARPEDGDRLLKEDARSVVSKRTMAEIAAAADRVWTSEGEVSPSAASRQTGSAPDRGRPTWPVDPASLGTAAHELPEFVAPELATLVDKPPAGEDWLHEIKFDGYRMQGRIEDGRASMRTRTGLDWTERFRHIADAAARLPVHRAIIDGEVVALQPSGVPSFALLQETLKSGRTERLVYYVFDLLFLEERDLRGAGLQQRKSLLEALVGDAEGPIRYSDHQIGSGPPFFENACRMALEGVVSKRMSAPYKSGRTREWLKSKCVERQEFVIGGFTKPTTNVRGVGALLLGYYDDEGKLIYVGRVGTGFSEATSRALREQLDGMITDKPPFAAIPAAAKRDVIWVEPRLVCEVEYRSWTHDGRLRHASFQGLREDKPAQSVHLERRDGASDGEAKSGGGGDRRAAVLDSVRLTHPDRVLYPQQGLTKHGLAEYYIEVADWILPHVAGRPLSLVRCPSGQGKECFYQKHITKGLPESLRQVMIRENESEEPYPVLDNLEGLLALVQMNVLEIHPWGSRADDVERPDRLIFDLDPDVSVPWSAVVAAGVEMRERLSALKLQSFVKTTGGKGLHVVVPIAPRQEWPEVKAFCEGVAAAAARDKPDRYTTNMAKAARPGKIFLDYLRNSRGATAIAAYSPRARPGAPVATPLAWEELSPAIASDHFTVATLPRRLKALARDPWADIGKLRQSIGGKLPSAKRGK